jgi:hypothetical protein
LRLPALYLGGSFACSVTCCLGLPWQRATHDWLYSRLRATATWHALLCWSTSEGGQWQGERPIWPLDYRMEIGSVVPNDPGKWKGA